VLGFRFWQNRRHRPTPQEVRADAPDLKHRLAKCAICINTYELPKGRHLGAGIETECKAGPMADAIALSEGISWPLDAVRTRILDADDDRRSVRASSTDI
jgi:hypothetical protein